MNPTLPTIGGAALIAALGACTVTPPPITPVAASERAPTTTLTAPPAPPSTPNGAGGAADPASSPVVVGSQPAATVVLAVPPLPARLPPVRPANDHDTTGDDHDHGESDGPLDDAGLAAAWIAAVYSGRFDQPDSVGVAVGQLAANDALAVTTVGSLPALDAAALEVRWPVVADVSDDGDGWWRVTFVLKHTRAGQVGPTTSDAQVARVHVTDGRVDGWEPPA